MFPDKKNILQLASLMLQHGIRHVVLSPGSRNAPLLHTFSQHPEFICYSVVDERSAAFFALGVSHRLQQPVAVCCTSGTALLNYGPAIAEAFYQETPLLVISADRPVAWIGQADGQTIPQNGIFTAVTKKSVQLPEINDSADEWHCNRLVNEALITLTAVNPGPVHINIPFSEPLYQFTEPALPEVRKINYHSSKQYIDIAYFKSVWQASSKRMIVVGQLPPGSRLDDVLNRLPGKADVVILSEHTGNIHAENTIGNFDLILASLQDDQTERFAPDLLITAGGHITSKRLKDFLRKHPAKSHWDIRPDGNVKDTFQSVTDLVPIPGVSFFSQLSETIDNKPAMRTDYFRWWEKQSQVVTAKTVHFMDEIPFCDMSVIHRFLNALPAGSALHLSNSAPIRYAQFCTVDPAIAIHANRGTNGIDGTVSTAVGYATVNEGMTFLLVGDLSFFYDINGLWNKYVNKKLRILLVNNSGGNMFHLINGARQSEALEEYIACHHTESAKDKALAFGMHYMSASSYDELDRNLSYLCNPAEDYPIVLEVFTNIEVNTMIFNALYKAIHS